MTDGDRQPVSFRSALSLVSLVSPWRLGSLLFPCQLGVFIVGLVILDRSRRVRFFD